jgi:putative sterol carrier protein
MNERANTYPTEQFRIAAKDWVQKDSAASLLEETKTAVLAQRMKALGDMPVAHAEREVKASPDWLEFIKGMVDARTAANLAKVRMEYTKMKVMEWQSENATRRAEMRLTE